MPVDVDIVTIRFKPFHNGGDPRLPVQWFTAVGSAVGDGSGGQVFHDYLIQIRDPNAPRTGQIYGISDVFAEWSAGGNLTFQITSDLMHAEEFLSNQIQGGFENIASTTRSATWLGSKNMRLVLGRGRGDTSHSVVFSLIFQTNTNLASYLSTIRGYVWEPAAYYYGVYWPGDFLPPLKL